MTYLEPNRDYLQFLKAIELRWKDEKDRTFEMTEMDNFLKLVWYSHQEIDRFRQQLTTILFRTDTYCDYQTFRRHYDHYVQSLIQQNIPDR